MGSDASGEGGSASTTAASHARAAEVKAKITASVGGRMTLSPVIASGWMVATIKRTASGENR